MRSIMIVFACLISMAQNSFAAEDVDFIAAAKSFLEANGVPYSQYVEVTSRRTTDGEVRVIFSHQDKLKLLSPDPEEHAIVVVLSPEGKPLRFHPIGLLD